MHEFSSQAAPGADNEPQDITPEELVSFSFKLDDAQFQCGLRTDADAVIEWSEFAAAALDSDIDSESPEGIALTSKLLKLAMPNGEYRRFRSHLRQHRTQPDTLIEVLQMINGEMEEAVSRRTARPTRQPSSSSTGDAEQEGRVARVISLQGGDVQILPMDQVVVPDGAALPQDHQPKRDGRSSSKAKATRGAGRQRTATAG
jgi:hypothetical protein